METIDSQRKPGRKGPGGKRGKVKTFSRAARRRMLKFVGSVDLREVKGCIFLTFTVPEGTMDWAECERRRRVWVERAKRRWGDKWFAVWRKEAQENGTPHLHVVMYFLDRLPHLRDEVRPWNDNAWHEICGFSQEWPACQSEFIRDAKNGAAFYISKYCAKVDDSEKGESCGKVWGVVNQAIVPVSKETVEVSKEELKLVERALVKLQRRKRERVTYFDGHRWRLWKGVGITPDQMRAMGVKVRVRRPRVMRRIERQIWQQDEESRKLSPGDVEIESVAPSLHFASAPGVLKLIAWARAEVRRRKLEAILEAESARIPF